MKNKNVLNKDVIGKNIKMLLLDSSYTFEGLADILNLASSGVIYDWINGIKTPSLDRLVKLSMLFKVTLEDILFGKDVF